MATIEKPPIGLEPRRVHDRARKLEILDAMKRFVDVDKPIPEVWWDELRDLLEFGKRG